MAGPYNLPLFERPKSPLAEMLTELAAERIYLGASSWKYEGWLGQIYSPERYFVRGKFSQRKFEQECLAEYAETFPIVCGDFSFYQFPTAEYWHKLFAGTPRELLFALKAPEMVTVRTWPSHDRYGDKAGLDNESFLDAELFRSSFLQLLEPYRERVAVLIFEFGAFHRKQFGSVDEFVRALSKFLDALPAGYRYAVEIRNREFFDTPYFECLKQRNVAHVFSSWTRMPPLDEQMANSEAYTADFFVARALLRPGRSYEEAVAKFQPYAHIQEEYPEAREALRALIQRAKRERKIAYIFANNRLEGNAPGTLQSVAAE